MSRSEQEQEREPVNPSVVNNCLMRLPLEIRLDIYTYLVVTPSGNICQKQYNIGEESRKLFYALDGEFRDIHPLQAFDPPILRVCRAVRKECLAVFYRHNTFCMDPLRDCGWSVEPTLSNLSMTNWLSSTNIQKLALNSRTTGYDFEEQIRAIQRAVDVVSQSSPRAPKSLSIIVNARMFSHLIRRSMVPSFELGYEGSELMLKYLECLKYCSRVLSGTKSLKLMVFTPNRSLSPLHQIQIILRKHDANRYLEDLHSAFGGELWVDGVLSRRDRVLLERPPFPLNCGQFNSVRVRLAQYALRNRERKLSALAVGHAEGRAFLKEANDSQHTSELASVHSKFALDTLKSLLDEVEVLLCEVKTCFRELDDFLRNPSLTQSEMNKKFHEWKPTVDLKMSDIKLPDLTEWEKENEPTNGPTRSSGDAGMTARTRRRRRRVISRVLTLL